MRRLTIVGPSPSYGSGVSTEGGADTGEDCLDHSIPGNRDEAIEISSSE